MRKFLIAFMLACSFLFLGNPDVFKAEEVFTLKLDGTKQENTLQDGEVHWYKFTLTQPGFVEMYTPSYIITFLYDENKEKIPCDGCNYWYNESNPMGVRAYLKSGTYYVSVERAWNKADYEFTTTVESSLETYLESNNTLDTASEPEFDKDIYGQIAHNDKIDIYRVVLPNGGKLTCNAISKIYYIDNVEYQLCDELGNTLIKETLGSESIYEHELAAGTYYIKVENGGTSLNYGYYGNYNFKLSFEEANETCAEPNNEKKDASLIPFEQKIRGQLAINDDQDVFKVSVEKKSRLFVDLTTYLEKCDVVISDEKGTNLLLENAEWDSIAGKEDYQYYVDVEVGTYYININRNRGYGNYELKVSNRYMLSESDISLNKSVTFTGSAVKVPVTVKYEGYVLKEGTDYKTSYKNNTNFGTATVTITGMGSYMGTFEKNFDITLKVGNQINTGDFTYKFTADNEVALVGITNKKLSTANLSGGAFIGGKYFAITEILSKAAYNNIKITKVVLPSSLKKIGSKAFYGCTRLKTVEFASVVSIPKDAFSKCGRLTKITGIRDGSSVVIGKNCYTMKGGTLQFTKLVNAKDTSLTVPATATIGAKSFKVTSIAAKAVDNTKIKTAVIGKNVSNIGDKAFQKCTVLTKVVFKGKNIASGVDVFDGCKKLKTIEGGTGSVFTIGKYKYKLVSKTETAFLGLKDNSVTKVVVPATAKIGAKNYKVTSIADSALSYKSIKSLEVGKNVKTIGKNACYGCSSLTKVMIKGKNLSIKENAFSYCGSLKAFSGLTGSEIIIGNYKYKVTSGSTVTFKGITGDVDDVSVYDSVTIGKNEFKVTAIADKALYKEDIVSVNIGANVTKIGKQAFEGCRVLCEVRIRTQKLKSIGSKAFYKTNSYVQIYVPSVQYKNYVKKLQTAGLSKTADIYSTY